MAPPAAMAAAAAAASEPDLSPAPSGAVQLLLRSIDSRTTVVRAQLEETLDSVLERLGMVVSRRVDLRVEYASRYLRREATIGELGLPQDATLHVTARILPTPYPVAWDLASEIAAAARFAATGQPGSTASLDMLVRKFLNEAHSAHEMKSGTGSPLGPVADHMGIFLRSGAPGALGQLYLSQDEACRVEAERAIRCFLTPDLLPGQNIVKVWTGPVLLEFSGSLATGGRHADPLYADLRRTLASVIVCPGWNPACWLDVSPEWVAEHLIRFAIEKANAVMRQIDGAYLLTADKQNLAEFQIFSTVLHRKGFGLDADKPRSPWWTALYETLVSLLRSVAEFMAMIKTSLRRRMHAGPSSEPLNWMAALPCVRIVLAQLDAWSDTDECPEIRSALRATLEAHALGTRVLALSAGAEWCQRIGWIIRHRDLLNFDTRRHLAMMLLPKLAAAGSHMPHEMLIDRSRLLADSFGYIADATPEKLRAGLLVEFRNERATGPGVLREWFCMVFQALFSPPYFLFSACPSDRRRFFINPKSFLDPMHLPYYRFLGRMIALALMHKISVGVLFDRTLFLQLAGRPVTLDDIADADPSLHASCKQILEMDPSLVDSNVLGLTFARDVELLGSTTTVAELVPGGKDITVNSKNRCEYINLLIQDSFVKCATNQVAYLSYGFSGMCCKSEFSKKFFSILNAEEFNQMLGGSKDAVDVEEWKAHTDYSRYGTTDHRVEWFWKAVEEMTVEQQRRLLFFWTSVGYLPFDGFSGLGSRLSIFLSPNSCDHLPTSATCFYQLTLPAYTSFDMMQSRLQMIVQEHVSSSFGNS